jgi:hypothetical protein
MIGTSRRWPPLIMAAHTPRWVKARDVVLTLMMWILFALMLETEFELFFGHHLKEMGLGDFHTEPNWPIFFERLRPYLVTTAGLAAFIAIASVRTLRHHRNSLLLPQPSPLPAAVQARRAGITEVALLAARDLPIAVAHIDTDGTYRIEALAPSTAELESR